MSRPLVFGTIPFVWIGGIIRVMRRIRTNKASWGEFPSIGGFTLMELIAVVSVGGLILAIAVPNLRSFIQNKRISAAATEFFLAVNTARSEAAKRARSVVICRSADPAATTPACGGTSLVWTDGWIMFNDCDNDGAPDIDPADTVCSGGTPESILQVSTAAPDGVTIKSDSDGDNAVIFRGDGSLGTLEVKYAVCDDRGQQYGQLMTIAPAGQASMCSLKDVSCVGGVDPCNTPS